MVNLQNVFCVLMIILKPVWLWESNSVVFTDLLAFCFFFFAKKKNFQWVGWMVDGWMDGWMDGWRRFLSSIFCSSLEL